MVGCHLCLNRWGRPCCCECRGQHARDVQRQFICSLQYIQYPVFKKLSRPPSLSVGLTSNQLSALSVLSSWWPDSRQQTGGRQYWQTLSSLLPVHSITAHWTACILHWLYHQYQYVVTKYLFVICQLLTIRTRYYSQNITLNIKDISSLFLLTQIILHLKNNDTQMIKTRRNVKNFLEFQTFKISSLKIA